MLKRDRLDHIDIILMNMKETCCYKNNGLREELTITGDDEQILETKQIVINELIRIRQKKN